MFETIVRMDLSQMDLYARHQQVAALFSRDRSSARDYQFAVEPGHLYLRSPEPRVQISGWREMSKPRAGRSYQASGVVYIDAARLSPERRPFWRTPPVTQRIVSDWLRDAGLVGNMSTSIETSLPMSKGARDGETAAPIWWSPVRFTCVLRVDTDEQADRAFTIQQTGIGRGKGFGFGCVHLREMAPEGLN